MPTCECCRKHWLVDCPNCGHSMLGYTAEYDADVIAAERARIRAAVEELEEPPYRSGPGLYLDGWRDGRAAVLAILDADV